MDHTAEERIRRIKDSLEGLSLGDGFGERLIMKDSTLARRLIQKNPPSPPWFFTDDTQMALSIVEILFKYGEIEQDALAKSFARNFEGNRGYGKAMYELVLELWNGEDWRTAAPALFNGTGSYGNGAAMRVAPVGAYFADDLEAVVEHAARSSVVTHAHPEASAGAIAVAVAAACAYRLRGTDPLPHNADFINLVLPSIPESFVKKKTVEARDLPPGTSVARAVRVLGNGSQISAYDTVPFVLWCAAQYLDDFEAAMWLTASGFGDMDTTCAMVGGIVASHVGMEGLPEEWLKRREALPDWPFKSISSENAAS